MRIARAEIVRGVIRYGLIEGEDFRPLAGPPFETALDQLIGERATMPLAGVRLLAPCEPSKIVAIGRNYAAHAAEHGADVPQEPLIFLKPPSAVIGPGDSIRLPALSHQVEHEGELVAVIGRRARHLAPEHALACVLGYTCGNDVTARDLQRRDGQWSRAKGFDTFCPLGPWIDTDLDPDNCVVSCSVNGAVRQQQSTADMVFNVATLLQHISAVMTLEPGDVVMTGTPSGVGRLQAGDRVEVIITGLMPDDPVVGPLANFVSA
jgi:2-keto-4-pentenoate hydratase/2-oxohepta-3-ene-1,7-dioic acid hydratase in catechol pathway